MNSFVNIKRIGMVFYEFKRQFSKVGFIKFDNCCFVDNQ